MTSSLALFFLQAGADAGFFNVIVEKFNEGGEFMWPVLIALILGLAIFLERIITLNLADINTRKFVLEVQQALQEGGIPAAQELCAKTRGPVASVFQAGLMRADEGIDAAEKAITTYGSIEMSFLERGLVWLSLFIAIAPLLGFLGTVVGMIEAFDAIEAAADISPSLVAGGIKVALLTTAGGLLAGIILQIGYNYCVSKIDRLISDMEESSITLIDSIVLLKEGKQIVPEGEETEE
ncbi:MAG: MotA/TolQ/ExbB proton channel family protein [Bacteroidetes bacterium]|jgi:biopolymer transport protein ExbB|uniref:MotA/TolQ/ExbB proton channel family protein n=1 Tax=Rhodohalobacter sulfatireducens TaxID=2911366 RepID=A0ABS9KBS9_9BACT|nr:MotA/TolQ/ExbB proton channel family protein [Rhodohalobacter sulfatireducens]MCG2588292.1 MotA/TolQ/ExbB proton channel family protein [Rhodohalobacter sulfatireducens]MDR9365740.1 MotA/TolQ/ExbB proton channel family protein [Balneolaceae bacterium]MDR9409457.1 MotA/TolQ/ExbB proton channel family protein [Balneolaceae bacterium]NBC66849.1 MotA/TolQ/ExbB proton channel family protein [Bacteroidota bacterium]